MRVLCLFLFCCFSVPLLYSQTKQPFDFTSPAIQPDAPRTSWLLHGKETLNSPLTLNLTPLVKQWAIAEPPTCYVISRYRVQRVLRGSDVTQIVGHSNCISSRNVVLFAGQATSEPTIKGH